MEVDYIIVGFGLAGLAFAEQLSIHEKSFVVFEDASQKSSLVAGGTYNPLVLKRFTPVWNGHQQLEYAMPFYEEIESKFYKQFDTKLKTLKIFNSIGDENNWFSASDKPIMSKYMIPKIQKNEINGIITNFGYGEVKGTGWIDVKKLIKTYKNHLKEKGVFIEKSFVYDDLKIEDTLIYQHLSAKKIVFCEGFGLRKNPFFNHLPLNGTKGETLTIYAPDLKLDVQIKSTVFIFPLGDDLYKVGATFHWTDKTSIPTEEGRIELLDKLKKVIKVPFTIKKQSAGIRPTVKDRRPLVGIHPTYKNLAVLNGLGTRGVMIAPTVSKNLYNLLEKGIALDDEINITRFQ